MKNATLRRANASGIRNRFQGILLALQDEMLEAKKAFLKRCRVLYAVTAAALRIAKCLGGRYRGYIQQATQKLS